MNTEVKLPFERSESTPRVWPRPVRQWRKKGGTAIVTDPANMNWLTGYDGWSFYGAVHQCVLVGLEGEPLWFGRGMDGQRRRPHRLDLARASSATPTTT